MEENKNDIVFKFLTSLACLFLLIFFVACFFQIIWNNSFVGAIEGVNPIGFWQAYGIMIMIYLIGRILNMDFDKK